ncbi:MAG: tetratricopeptide repeat protein [Planctomycetota bacterium]
MLSRPALAVLAGVGLVLGGFLLLRLSSHAAAASGYVGSRACVRCHAEQHELWRGSHHDLAMQIASEATVLGDFSGASVTVLGVTSTFTKRDGKFFVRTEGQDGKLADYEIRYCFGVDPLQQYLIVCPGGRLQALSLAWDARPGAEGGQRWFHLYPHERIAPDDPLHWTGPNQNWNYMCAECHSTNLRKNYDPEGDRYRTTWSEIDVACEACHGSGAAHVAWAEQGASERDARKGLGVRLQKSSAWTFGEGEATARRLVPLPANAQVETCARCHAHRNVIREDYVHGLPLMDSHRPSLLDAGLYHADGQIKEEVYVYGSFLQSRMHRAGVTCSDCHDPHSLELRGEGNALCSRCHAVAVYDRESHHFHRRDSSGARCTACHMPARTYMVVDPRRDHSFRVPRPDLSVELGTPNACNGCHQDQDAKWASAQVVKWYGPERKRGADFARALDAGRRRLPGAAPLLRALAQHKEEAGIVRATALSLLGPWPEPATHELAAKMLQDSEPLVREAALGLFEGLPRELLLPAVTPLLSDPVRAVRIEAARVLADIRPDSLPEKLGASFRAALDECLEAGRVNGDRGPAQVHIGALLARQGRFREARSAYERALRLSPGLVTATVNLADLCRQLDRDTEGRRLLAQAVASQPGEPSLHHALGLALVRLGRHREALASFRESARLAPEIPRFARDYGIALDSLGQSAKAFLVLEAAQHRHPGDRELLVALATLGRDRGNRAAALRFARKLRRLLPSDRSAQRLVAELESSGKR